MKHLVKDLLKALIAVGVDAAMLYFGGPFIVMALTGLMAYCSLVDDMFDSARNGKHYAANFGCFAIVYLAINLPLAYFVLVSAVAMVASVVLRHWLTDAAAPSNNARDLLLKDVFKFAGCIVMALAANHFGGSPAVVAMIAVVAVFALLDDFVEEARATHHCLAHALCFGIILAAAALLSLPLFAAVSAVSAVAAIAFRLT